MEQNTFEVRYNITGDELVIEMPLTGFTPEKLDNLAKLVTAKESLLKAALGAPDLPFSRQKRLSDSRGSKET
jgi:hypothetical protein